MCLWKKRNPLSASNVMRDRAGPKLGRCPDFEGGTDVVYEHSRLTDFEPGRQKLPGRAIHPGSVWAHGSSNSGWSPKQCSAKRRAVAPLECPRQGRLTRVKKLLYVLRTATTGIRLLSTGVPEAGLTCPRTGTSFGMRARGTKARGRRIRREVRSNRRKCRCPAWLDHVRPPI
jgi:hypothetical protein